MRASKGKTQTTSTLRKELKMSDDSNVTITITQNGQTIFTQTSAAKVFSTGKRGYGAQGRTMLPDGTPLMVSCNLVVPKSAKGEVNHKG